MDEREAKARGMIDTLEVQVEIDHLIVIPVLAVRRLGLKEKEIQFTLQNGQPHKLFHPLDANVERLCQEAVRRMSEQLRQEQGENP